MAAWKYSENHRPTVLRSSRIALQLTSDRYIDTLKRLLEAWDNLAYQTTLDAERALVELVHAPTQAAEMELFLASAQELLTFQRLDQFLKPTS